MVLISKCNPRILNAYSTVPLTLALTSTVQHAIWDGTFARFGNPPVKVAIHDRPEFHDLSHYQIRTRLDSEDMTSYFLVIDENTASTQGTWLVETTERCRLDTNNFLKSNHPPIMYPGEDFALWQVYLHAADAPALWSSWSIGMGSMIEPLQNRGGLNPYDSRDPQLPPYTFAVNWTDESNAAFWGSPSVSANFSEIEWSTRDEDRSTFTPKAPVVVRLKLDVARDNGLHQQWSYARSVPKPNKTIHLSASYNWHSPKWPKHYPELAAGELQVLTPSIESSGINQTIGLGVCNFLGSHISLLGSPQLQKPAVESKITYY